MMETFQRYAASLRLDSDGGGGGCSFAACLGNLTIDHAPLSRRRTVLTSNRGTSNHAGARYVPAIYYMPGTNVLQNRIPFLFPRLRQPSAP